MASPSKQAVSLEGTRVDHFQLSRKISEGGMGEVYEGIDENTKERIALKVLHQDIAKHREVTLRFINGTVAKNLRRKIADSSGQGTV